MNENFEYVLTFIQKSEPAGKVNQEILDNIAAAKKANAAGSDFKYEERDVILYNLGIGAKKTDLPYVLYVPFLSISQPNLTISKRRRRKLPSPPLIRCHPPVQRGIPLQH